MLLLCIAFSTSLKLSAQQRGNTEQLGRAKDFIEKLKQNQTAQKNVRSGDQSFPLGNDGKLNANLKTFQDDDEVTIYTGGIVGVKLSNVVIEIKEGKVSGTIINTEKKTAFRYSTNQNDEVILKEEDIDKVICVDFKKARANKNKRALSATSSVPADITKLHSNINAPTTVYLDFDGEYVVCPDWNQGNPIDAMPSNLSPEDIYTIWSIVAEDFSPFNVDITTDRAYYDSKPFGVKHMNIFTPTTTASPEDGGVAQLNSFTRNYFCPSWSFNLTVKAAGETASHEIGHTLGLAHDGLLSPKYDYYWGQGIWAPIMGAAFDKAVSQWSRGQYTSASNLQDDLSIIARPLNKMGYKMDDFGNNIYNAYTLRYISTAGGNIGVIDQKGIIAQNNDTDMFKFTTNGGSIYLNIKAASPQYGIPVANLDISVELLNSSGTLISGANQPTGMDALINGTLPAGTYYLKIEGTGNGNPYADGYSDYGSIGTYNITGTIYGAVLYQLLADIRYPIEGSELISPASINIKPDLSSPTPVIKVEYFDNGVKIGESVTTSSSHNLTFVPAEGAHSIYVKAYNSGGQVTTSPTVNFKVYPKLTPVADNGNKQSDLIYEYHEATYTALPNFNTIIPLYKGTSYGIDLTDLPTRADNFAIRFTGYIYVYYDMLYKFSLTSDDGSKLYLGSKLLINNDGNHAAKEVTAKVALSPGLYPITVEYYEATASQTLTLKAFNDYDGQEAYMEFYHDDIIPKLGPPVANKMVSGVKYEYNEGSYNQLPDFNLLSFKSTGPIQDFNLGIPGRTLDNFAVRYTAIINLPYTGEYKFFTNSDDGSKLYIDDILVVSNDGTHAPVERNGSIWLWRGKHKIRVEYFEKTSSGETLTVSYSGPGVYKQVIPTTVLSRMPVTGEQVAYFNELPIVPGGIILAENYDQGGEGYAYHDSTAGNQFNLFRNDGVDVNINPLTSNDYLVSGIQDREWIEYTVNAYKSGPVNINVICSSGNGTSKIHFERNGVAITPTINIPAITNGQPWQTVTIPNINFNAGEQIIRIFFDKGGFKLDYIQTQDATATRADNSESTGETRNIQAIAYPNPFDDQLNIDLTGFENVKELKIFSINGTEIWKTSNGELKSNLYTFREALPSGMYVLEIISDNKVSHSTIIKK